MLSGPVSPSPSGCEWSRWHPNTTDSFEYTEQAVIDYRQAVVLQLVSWAGDNNPSPYTTMILKPRASTASL